MQIKVTPHTITLNKTEIVNEGEYNINTCEFELSEEYTGLTNMAIFTNGTNTFKTMIVDNQCIIPYEVLEQEGTLMVGVYGYEADGETLIKRYSPTPVAFYIEKGSYALAQEGEQPSPSIIEQLQEEIEQNSNDIATLQESVSSINQELPSFAKKTEIPTKTSQLQNDSGFITKSVNDLENYTKTSDLSSVATSGAYSDLSGTPDLTDYVKNTDYATGSKGGVIKIDSSYFGADLTNGKLYCIPLTYSAYQNKGDSYFVSKGTLENVITGKDLTTKAYVDGLVGDINTALDTINGEVL